MNQLFGEQDRLLREVGRYVHSQILELNLLQVTLEVIYQEPPEPGLQISIESEPQVELTLTDPFYQLLIDLDQYRDAQGIKWNGFRQEVTSEGEVEINFVYPD